VIARSPAPLTLNLDHTQISMETKELALPSATEVHCTTPCPCCLRSPARVDVLSSRQPRSLRQRERTRPAEVGRSEPLVCRG